MVSTGEGQDKENWRGKVTSSQDPGAITRGAGMGDVGTFGRPWKDRSGNTEGVGTYGGHGNL